MALFVLLVGPIAFYSVYVMIEDISPGTFSRPAVRIQVPVVPVSTSSPRYTLQQYQAIEDGMSYRQVTRIMGDGGTEEARNEVDLGYEFGGSIETISYRWMNADGSNMSVMFQNDAVVMKAQAFLP